MSRPLFPDEPNWDDFPEDSSKIESELRDERGDSISKGGALLFTNDTASFFPYDAASQDSILTRSRSLFLNREKRSLTLASIKPVPAGVA